MRAATAAMIAMALSSWCLEAQEPQIGGESLPDESFLQKLGGITLHGDLAVTGDPAAAGAESQAAEKSPQMTAPLTDGISANAGLYANRIADFVPPLPFSEICFKNGLIYGDIHTISETTQGGSCVPGDLGWVLERNQRTAADWENARVACLLDGMRLPESFEYLYSCNNAATFGFNGMTNDWEWASNSSFPVRISTTNGAVSATAGNGSCNVSGLGWLGSSTNIGEAWAYRCLR